VLGTSLGEPLPDQFGVSENDRQRIVDLVSHPGGQGADRGQFFGVVDHFIQLSLFGDVATEPENHRDLFRFVAEGNQFGAEAGSAIDQSQ